MSEAPVKESSEARPCAGCSAPTWSATGLCVRCRNAVLPAPPSPVVEPPPVFAPDGRVIAHLACIGCGYDLMGLSAPGGCPECGKTIAETIRGDRLEYADADWVGSLALGAKWLMISTLAGFGVMIFGAAVIFLLGGPAAQPPPALNVISSLIGLGMTALMVWAVWQLTMAEPLRPGSAGDSNRSRLAARLVMIATIPGAMAQVIASPFLSIPAGAGFSMVVTVASQIIAVIGWLAILDHLRSLMLRVPDRSLAVQLRIVLWGAIGGVGLPVIFLTSMLFLRGGAGMSPVWQLFTTGTCLGLVAAVICGLWSVVLVIRCSVALDRVHRRMAVYAPIGESGARVKTTTGDHIAPAMPIAPSGGA